MICINDSAGEADSEILTYGKTYEVKEPNNKAWSGIAYKIVADNNEVTYVARDRFATVEKWREIQLSNLLE